MIGNKIAENATRGLINTRSLLRTTDPFSGLPYELLWKILKEIPALGCLELSTVSKHFNAVFEDDLFWKNKSIKLYSKKKRFAMRSRLIFSVCNEIAKIKGFMHDSMVSDFDEHLKRTKYELLFFDQPEPEQTFKFLSYLSEEKASCYRLCQLLKHVNKKLWSNKDFIMQILSLKSVSDQIVKYIDKEFWNDREFILCVLPMTSCLSNIEKYLPVHILKDKSFIIKYVSLVASPFYILERINKMNESDQFWSDRDFTLQLAPYCRLKCLPKSLQFLENQMS